MQLSEARDYIDVFHGTPTNVISDCIRGFLCAPPGKKLIACDFSAIEARVLAWLAGEEDVLNVFRTHGKIYEFTASQIYEVPISSVTTDQRLIGKVATLALGFQGGVGAFQSMAKNYFVKVPDKMAENIKKAWRARNQNIVQYWWDLDNAAIAAVENPGIVTTAGAAGREVRYVVKGSFLLCRLPSGRVISYPYPKMVPITVPWGGMKNAMTYMTQMSGQPKKVPDELKNLEEVYCDNKWRRIPAYGGLMAENCLAGNVKILTQTGFKNISELKPFEKVFDGLEFVTHGGLLNQGKRKVVKCLGMCLTENHLIHDGNSWKPAGKMDQKHWVQSLKLGRSLVGGLLLNLLAQWGERAFASVIAGLKSASLIGSFLGNNQLNVEPAALKIENTDIRNILKTKKFQQSGLTFTLESSLDAITQKTKPIKTMELGGLRYGQPGKKINLNFSSTPLQLKILISYIWSWIGLTIQKAMSLATSEWCQEEKTRITSAQIRPLNLEKINIQSVNFGGNTLKDIGATTSFITGWLKTKAQKKFIKSVGNQDTFDILNCGPRNQFLVFTKFGPVLAHNCTQATARDLLRDAMFRWEKAGYEIVHHVHDELICEVDEGFGSLEEAENLMRIVPDWAKDLPIHSEGWAGKRYRK